MKTLQDMIEENKELREQQAEEIRAAQAERDRKWEEGELARDAEYERRRELPTLTVGALIVLLQTMPADARAMLTTDSEAFDLVDVELGETVASVDDGPGWHKVPCVWLGAR